MYVYENHSVIYEISQLSLFKIVNNFASLQLKKKKIQDDENHPNCCILEFVHNED